MIPQTDISPADWRAQLREVITSGEDLLRLLHLRPEQVGYSSLAVQDFALKVPRAFVGRMRVGDPEDPLLRQVLASAEELLVTADYSADPVGETGDAIRHPGIIQKYHGRLLLMLSSGCAINCRYCFRRHFPYHSNQNSRREWLQALEHVATDTSISEVIFSGGDPLLVADEQLADLVERIATIPHVQRIRVHTRLPVVIPERVTPALLEALAGSRLQSTVVIHTNHANELDDKVAAAMQALRSAGITLLNQAVLLKGVNDSKQALVELSERLFALGVLPYYLHLLDKVQGAAHFDVSAQRAVVLADQVAAELPGYLVPRLVREEAGQPAKVGVNNGHALLAV
ncbi:EF-P beta-lysylation protein EpmB [Pseudohalioglobus lutimaris]|uniref:L-lysine 2,3-aminomutase n=1 Tax=Pseudohalioglobus lutimaris TaxID=1737061 RepID=A0A2N5X8J0_9GAMM|nr:EF-P beta-lysylation protein EpmB [Pseudohalioglobus lutimaris]PLW70779.1 EF-P beta-lysylation protein EpmB [Pseudohalioglobus lutimaris]